MQPAEPLDLWQSPPFEPTPFEHSTDGPSLRARGAADDKGCLASALHGLEAVFRTSAEGGGGFPLNVKLMLEGQEEIGSPQLQAFVAQHGKPGSLETAPCCHSPCFELIAQTFEK